MKNNIIISLLLGMLFINTACEELDRDALYQNEFRKIVYLKTNGIIDMTLYKTGEDVDYQFSVVKTGAYSELTAEANLQFMTEAELNEYCEPRGLNLRALPANCYELSNTQFQFGSNEDYKLVNLTMHTTAIDEYSDGNTETETEYVIPMILKSEKDSINSTMNILIIKPNVVTPAVVFQNDGLLETYCSKGITNIEVPLELQIENKWDFTCTVEVDPTATGGNELLTKGYKLENNGLVTFTKGNRTAILNISFNREEADLSDIDFTSPVLPLRIKEISIPTFDADKKTVQLAMSSKYPLTVNMLATNAQEPSEGSLSALLDGNISTYFHSAWSVGVTGQHYVQVNLSEALSSFRFSYTNRSSNGSAALASFIVSTSTDGNNFTTLKNYAWDVDGLPGTAAGVFESTELEPAIPVKNIRFTCTGNWSGEAFFVWSEFSLYGF